MARAIEAAAAAAAAAAATTTTTVMLLLPLHLSFILLQQLIP